MGFNFDINAALPLLKNKYTKKKVETITFQSTALKAMPKAETEGGGAAYIGAIRSALSTSISASDAIAFTSGSASQFAQWVCPWKTMYASANVSGEAIARTKGDQNAFVEVIAGEMEAAYAAVGLFLGAALFSNGGGSIGQISSASNVTTNAITLANPSQTVSFTPGMIVQLASDDGTGGAGVRVGTATVSKVNIVTGVITFSAVLNSTITAAAPSDFIFPQGNYASVIQGIPSWIPTTDPTSTLFNGVDRSVDVTRLGGCRYNGGGAPKMESVNKLAMYVNRMSGRPDLLVLSPLDFADICNGLMTSVRYADKASQTNPSVSFSGIKLNTPYGEVMASLDPFCPQGIGYLLQSDTWLLPSMGALPYILEEDKNTWLRQAGADSYQLRLAARGATYCSAPGKNGVVVF